MGGRVRAGVQIGKPLRAGRFQPWGEAKGLETWMSVSLESLIQSLRGDGWTGVAGKARTRVLRKGYIHPGIRTARLCHSPVIADTERGPTRCLPCSP